MIIDTLRSSRGSSGHLDQDTLDFSTPGMLTIPLLDELLTQPFGAPPSVLDVSKNQLPDTLGPLLATSERLHAHLELLDVSWNPIGRDGLLHVLRAPFDALHTLVAQNISIWRGHIHEVAKTTWPEKLAHLDLGNNRLTDSGVEALLTSPQTTQLKSLHLQENQCTDSTIAHLATCAALTELRALDLSTNQLTDEGLIALVGSPCLHHLAHLNLSHNRVRRGFIDALDRDGSTTLETLHLDHTRCGVRAIETLAKSTVFGSLETLSLRDGSLSDNAIKSLARSETLGALTHLNLSRNALTDKSITELANGPLAESLQRLNLNFNAITLHGALTLLDETVFPTLTHINLRGDTLEPDHITLLQSLPRVSSGTLTLEI